MSNEVDYEVEDWEEVEAKALEALEKQRDSMHWRVCGNWYHCMYDREVQDEAD